MLTCLYRCEGGVWRGRAVISLNGFRNMVTRDIIFGVVDLKLNNIIGVIV